MPPRDGCLDVHTAVRIGALIGTSRHLDLLAVGGFWNAVCDRLHDRLGFYGMGRN